jgi:hypothetical protein
MTAQVGVGGAGGRQSRSECRHEVAVADRVRTGCVDHAFEVGTGLGVERAAHDGQPVVDVDPADPLGAGTDAPAEPPPGETHEPVQGRGAPVEDDAGAQDDTAIGPRTLEGLLPHARHTGHLRRAGRRGSG